MNTYRAMGFTGYRFKNDSATEKFVFPNYSDQKDWCAKFKQKKTGGRLASAGGSNCGSTYWPVGTSEEDAAGFVCVVAGVWVAGVLPCVVEFCVAGVWVAGVCVAGVWVLVPD